MHRASMRPVPVCLESVDPVAERLPFPILSPFLSFSLGPTEPAFRPPLNLALLA